MYIYRLHRTKPTSRPDAFDIQQPSARSAYQLSSRLSTTSTGHRQRICIRVVKLNHSHQFYKSSTGRDGILEYTTCPESSHSLWIPRYCRHRPLCPKALHEQPTANESKHDRSGHGKLRLCQWKNYHRLTHKTGCQVSGHPIVHTAYRALSPIQALRKPESQLDLERAGDCLLGGSMLLDPSSEHQEL